MSWLETLGVFRRPPSARPAAEIEADVRAEIEHHLACKERELVEQGLTSEAARAEAHARFGDVAAAHAACVRIQTGERIMLQRIHFAMTLLLLAGVLVLACRAGNASRDDAQVPEAARRPAPAPVEHVIVEVGDRIQFIDQFNPDEVRGVVEVAEDGKIPLPEVGWVFVAGKTREEVEQDLTRALAPYFVESKVQVLVKKPRPGIRTLDTVFFEAF